MLAWIRKMCHFSNVNYIIVRDSVSKSNEFLMAHPFNSKLLNLFYCNTIPSKNFQKTQTNPNIQPASHNKKKRKHWSAQLLVEILSCWCSQLYFKCNISLQWTHVNCQSDEYDDRETEREREILFEMEIFKLVRPIPNCSKLPFKYPPRNKTKIVVSTKCGCRLFWLLLLLPLLSQSLLM